MLVLPGPAEVCWPQPPKTTLSPARDSQQRHSRQVGQGQTEDYGEKERKICPTPKPSQWQEKGLQSLGSLMHRAWSKGWWQ